MTESDFLKPDNREPLKESLEQLKLVKELYPQALMAMRVQDVLEMVQIILKYAEQLDESEVALLERLYQQSDTKGGEP